MVIENGALRDAEVDYVDVNDGSQNIRIYLMFGRPELSFTDNAGNNELSLAVPLYGLGAFASAPPQRLSLDVVGSGFSIGLRISGVKAVGSDNAVKIDMSAVTPNDVEIATFSFVEKPTHVGATSELAGIATDQYVDGLLAKYGVAFTAEQLRTEIAGKLTSKTFANKSVPINPGGNQPQLAKWDLMTFNGSGAGAVLELYDDNGQGKGQRVFGSDIIPQGPPPRYGWSAAIRTDVLLEVLDIVLDRGDFLRQGAIPNTSDAPHGYMIVPAMGQIKYSLPGHADSVMIKAPDNGRVQVVVAGGFGKLTRGDIRVLGSNNDTSFEADDNGNVDVTVAANAGDRLAFIVHAIPVPGEDASLVWRPNVTIQDGSIRFDFHYWKDWLCDLDLEGDGMIVAELFADRTATFKLGSKVIDSDLEFPIWVWAVTFFVGNAVTIVGAAIALILVATVAKDAVIDELDPQGEIDGKVGQFNAKLPKPNVPNTAIFLDDVIVSEGGLQLSGRGDAGRIKGYGRQAAKASGRGTEIQGTGLYAAFDWQDSTGTITVKPRGFSLVAEADSPANFWATQYDGLPELPFKAHISRDLSPGESVTFFVDGQDTIVKILFERGPIAENQDSDVILVSWIAYTRKSTEDGLEQAFNSLDAQYEACAAYAASQRHEGWALHPDRYDDGGFSGGNLMRPGLKRLLADVAAGKVDIILLYKIDRLTRSLADFARIVDVLDKAEASFVSITQSFNTTTSMGRLTLNMLLSFAQFEREVTGERIRDKIAASKRRGMWMGGTVPLGYDVRERKLVANEGEATLVRHIMERYLVLGSVPALVAELERQGHRTKLQAGSSGPHWGGCPFRRGTLYHLLTNAIYRGKIVHKGEQFEGEHDPIVPADLWDQVQGRWPSAPRAARGGCGQASPVSCAECWSMGKAGR